MKKIVLVIGCLSSLFFMACQKELSDNFTIYTGNPLNDTIWVRNVPGSAAVHGLADLLFPAIIIDSIEVTRDTTLKYGDSLEITITGGSCIGPSGPVTGKVRLELLRLKSKGDFIKAFRPTVTGNGSLLETTNAFFLRIIKEGKDCSLASGTSVKIRFSDSEDPKVNMQVFNGQEANPAPFNGIDTAFSWQRDQDTTWLKTFQKSSQGTGSAIKGYELLAKNLRWVAAERFVDSTRPKAKITAILPPNFTDKNTAVFAVFAEQKTVVYMHADFASRSFAASKIPLGSKIKIVSVSRIGDDLYLGTKDINDVGATVAYSIKPDKKSLKDIVAFLNGL
jgi:hypothetical protein